MYHKMANWLCHNKYGDFAFTWNFPDRKGCRTLQAWPKPPGSVRRSNVWQRGWASSPQSRRSATEPWGNSHPHTARPMKHTHNIYTTKIWCSQSRSWLPIINYRFFIMVELFYEYGMALNASYMLVCGYSFSVLLLVFCFCEPGWES